MLGRISYRSPGLRAGSMAMGRAWQPAAWAALLSCWAGGALAQAPLVNFDDVSDQVDLAVRYRPLGVVLGCLRRDGSACAGAVKAATPRGSQGSARSGSQVVTLPTASWSLRPAFNETDGYLKLHFLSPVRSVSLQARAYKPSLASSQNRPFLQAFNAANQWLATVELPTVTGHGGDWQPLTITRPTADIQYVVASSYSGRTGVAVYGLFDDLWFDPVPLPQWMAVSAGSTFSLALRTDGTLWTWGANNHGQLGQGHTATADHPVKVDPVGHGRWRSVSGGLEHSLGIQDDGTLWAWGANADGRLGDGSTVRRTAPVRVGTASDWLMAQAGGSHSLALRHDGAPVPDQGTVWSWGDNVWGQLGDGTQTNRLVPTQVPDLLPMSRVHAGEGYSMAVVEGAPYLHTWGYNALGQLADGTTETRLSPTSLNMHGLLDPASAGAAHGVAVHGPSGSLRAWGFNSHGQLGNGSTGTALLPVTIGGEWRTVSAGLQHTVGIQRDGSLWAWGRNSDGQLGDGSTQDRQVPTRIGNGTRWVAVAAGFSHTLALQDDGSLWAWGRNDNAQLGARNRAPALQPQPVAAIQVQAISGPHGSLNPSGTLAVAYGATLDFQVQADAGHAAQVSGCGGTLAGTRYTTAPVAGDCTVQARFDALKLPNLIVQGLGVPRRVAAGQRVSLIYTVANTGTAAAPASRTCLSVTRVSTVLTRPAALGCSTQAGLAVGASKAVARAITLPSRLATGRWSLTVRADGDGAVTESDETDNAASATVQVAAP